MVDKLILRIPVHWVHVYPFENRSILSGKLCIKSSKLLNILLNRISEKYQIKNF